MALVREDEAGAARPDDRRDLLWLVRRVERHGDGADAEDAQIRRAPAGIVVREDGNPIARGHAAAGEPRAGSLRGGPQLEIREAIDAIPALDLDGDAVAEARRGLIEQIEEGIDAGIIRPRSGRRAREAGRGDGSNAEDAKHAENISIPLRSSRALR